MKKEKIKISTEKKYIDKYRNKYRSFDKTPTKYKYIWNSDFGINQGVFLNKYWITENSIIQIPENSTHKDYVRSVGNSWIKVISNYRGELYFIVKEYNLNSNKKIKNFLDNRNEYNYYTVIIFSIIDDKIYQYSSLTREGYFRIKTKIEARCTEYEKI